MDSAFLPRDDCPEIPTIPKLEIDLGVDCTMPDVGLPFCEAPDFGPPTPVEPYGCPEPKGSGSVTVIPGVEPNLRVEYTGGNGDNCSKELSIDLEIPPFVYDCTYFKVGNVTSKYTGGKPKVTITVDEANQIEPPECGDIIPDFNFEFPCIRTDFDVNFTTDASKPAHFGITCDPPPPGQTYDDCDPHCIFEVNIPPFDEVLGVCEIKTTLNINDAPKKPGKTNFFAPVAAAISVNGDTLSANGQTLSNTKAPPTEYYADVFTTIAASATSMQSGDFQTLTDINGREFADGLRIGVVNSGSKNGIYVTQEADEGYKMVRAPDMTSPGQVRKGLGVKTTATGTIHVVENNISSWTQTVQLVQYTAKALPYPAGTRILVYGSDTEGGPGIYTVGQSSHGWTLTRSGDANEVTELKKNWGVKVGTAPIYPTDEPTPSGGWDEYEHDQRPIYIITQAPAKLGDKIKFTRFNPDQGSSGSFRVVSNSLRECEKELILDLYIPSVSGGGSFSGELFNDVQTRFVNVRKNTAGVKGGSGGGGGAGGGADGGGPSEGLGDDNACTDLRFRLWDPAPPPSSRNPQIDYDYPDFTSIYSLRVEEEPELKLAQPVEVAWNRRAYLQMNVCRNVVQTLDENGLVATEDCQLVLDVKPMAPGTIVRLGFRATDKPENIGINKSVKDREGAGSFPTKFSGGDGSVDEVVIDEETGVGGCTEPKPKDELIGIPRIEPTGNYDFADMQTLTAPKAITEQGVPFVRLIRSELFDGNATISPEPGFPDGKLINSHQFTQSQNATTPPKVVMQGGVYATFDEQAMRDGHMILDLHSDLELLFPSGFTGIIPLVQDFHMKPAENKIILERVILVVHDGIISHRINKTEYELQTGKMRQLVNRANLNGSGDPDPDFEIVADDSRQYDKFAFEREIPILVCDTEEEEGGGIGGGG